MACWRGCGRSRAVAADLHRRCRHDGLRLPAGERDPAPARLPACLRPGRGHLVTVRDADGRTTVPGVLGVGDGCGLGGARAAEAEGVLAGLAAAAALGRSPARDRRGPGPSSPASAGSRRRCGSCSRRPDRASRWPTPRTIVCRCEEVTLGEVEIAMADAGNALGSVKRAYAGRDGPLPGPLLRAAAGRAAGRADRAGAGRARLLRAEAANPAGAAGRHCRRSMSMV